MKKILLTLTGISGSGKTTMLSELINDFDYHKVITCTTRDPRKADNEINGIDYFFLDNAAFEKDINDNKFVEYEKFDDNYYGTPWSQVVSKDTLPVAILEPNGAQNMKRLFSGADSQFEVIRVLLECPKEVAIERITKRDASIPERLNKRLDSINGKESSWQDQEYDLKVPFGSSTAEMHNLITKKIIEVQNNVRDNTVKSKNKISR